MSHATVTEGNTACKQGEHQHHDDVSVNAGLRKRTARRGLAAGGSSAR